MDESPPLKHAVKMTEERQLLPVGTKLIGIVLPADGIYEITFDRPTEKSYRRESLRVAAPPNVTVYLLDEPILLFAEAYPPQLAVRNEEHDLIGPQATGWVAATITDAEWEAEGSRRMRSAVEALRQAAAWVVAMPIPDTTPIRILEQAERKVLEGLLDGDAWARRRRIDQ